MKIIFLICFLSIHTLGLTWSTQQTTRSNKTILEQRKKEAFLTSFIENDQLYLNIPNQVLGKPMLFVRYDQSYQRKNIQVVWSLFKDKIFLKSQSIQSTAGIILPFKKKLALPENILSIFSVENKYGNQGSYCINITDLVLRQDIEWTPGFKENLVPQISLLSGVKDLENEIVVKTKRGLVMDGSKVSIPVYFGFYALGKPMKARRYDYRMGFWNEEINGIDYDGVKNSIANISRWRLEKKYNDQKISVPVKPITFIISPEVPKKWRPYVKAGIEEWLPAFESAGFKNALVVEEVDSLSYWRTYSINTSVVHWSKKKYLRGYENEEFGGTISSIVDKRTGEILKSDIYLGASPQNLAERYFIRAAPLDKRAQKFPFPDELIGALYQCLTAHEVGHTFGLMDSNFGEYSYPFDKMNDIDWLKTMGHTPSVMNYTRPNNIPQPEDSIPPYLLIQKVGPIDLYNIRWAYTEFLTGTSHDEKDAALERIIRLQDSVLWYRYNNGQYEVIGPAATNEVVETNNPVKSTKMALKNLKRVIELLPEVNRDQKDNARLNRLYDKTLELWFHHMRHVVSVIGGYGIQYKSINQPGSIYTPIVWEAQKEAIEFLILNAFNPPEWLIEPEFNSKIKYSTYPDKILAYQQRLLFELLRPQRMKRFEYLESTKGYERALDKYVTELQSGLFRELKGDPSTVKRRNQEVQMTYIDKLIWIIQQERANFNANEKAFDYSDYSKGLMMEKLMILKRNIEKLLRRNKNKGSIGHWKLCLYKLNEIP